MQEKHELAHEIDRVMRKLEARLHKEMPRIDTGKVGPMGGMLLMQLEAMQPCRIHALATSMGRDNSQITRLLNNLEAKHLIERYPDPNDARATLLRLTEAGSAFLLGAKVVIADIVADVTRHLSPKEVIDLKFLLQKL